MGFNITSWSKSGRDFGRGAPPPRGSLEYIAVGSMWTPDPPPRTTRGGSSSSAGEEKAVSFTEIDAADRWLTNIHRSLVYARKIHGDKIITKADVVKWDDFIARWNPFRDRMTTLHVLFMSAADKRLFHDLLNESHKLYQSFTTKGMSPIPVPYAAELVTLLRTMPKQITAAQMYSKLIAGIQCGDKLLDDKVPWYAWKKSGDTKPLAVALDSAKAMGAILTRSKATKETYGSGDPVYDEFLRRLTRIWIEAAGLYGIEETQRTADAQLKDDLKAGAKNTPSNILWLLATAGVSYLGIKWVMSRPAKVTVSVPHAYREEPAHDLHGEHVHHDHPHHVAHHYDDDEG
jgi:hypothetical protein